LKHSNDALFVPFLCNVEVMCRQREMFAKRVGNVDMVNAHSKDTTTHLSLVCSGPLKTPPSRLISYWSKI
jgi:hypothetical protein